jgi:hypothetical protein
MHDTLALFLIHCMKTLGQEPVRGNYQGLGH